MDESTTRVIQACRAFVQTRDDAWALAPDAAAFAHALILATGAQRALEISTSYGYSGLWIGAALRVNGGRLTTIDKDRHKQDIAAGFFAQAGLSGVIACRAGIAADIVCELDGPFDFVLNDADKENCTAYARAVLPMLAPRGVLLTDNTISHAEQLADFVAWARAEQRLTSVHLAIGNGMEMSVKRA